MHVSKIPTCKCYKIVALGMQGDQQNGNAQLLRTQVNHICLPASPVAPRTLS